MHHIFISDWALTPKLNPSAFSASISSTQYDVTKSALTRFKGLTIAESNPESTYQGIHQQLFSKRYHLHEAQLTRLDMSVLQCVHIRWAIPLGWEHRLVRGGEGWQGPGDFFSKFLSWWSAQTEKKRTLQLNLIIVWMPDPSDGKAVLSNIIPQTFLTDQKGQWSSQTI